MNKALLAISLAASLTALAPAFGDETAPPTSTTPAFKPYPKGISCGYIPNLRGSGFGVIDEKHVLIDGSGRHKFLVTLMTNCWALNRAIGIALERHGGFSDLCTGDAILADRDRCIIRYVEEVANRKEGETIVAGRLAAEKAEREGH